MCAVLIYIDDIIIYSRNEEEHAHHLELVMDRQQNAGSRVKPDKCKMAHTEVKLLGYIVGTNGITSDLEKTNKSHRNHDSTHISHRGKKVYGNETIPDYAKIGAPLIVLTRKGVTWDWSMPEKMAFDVLKKAPQSNNILAYPQTNKPYKLYTDTCDFTKSAAFWSK